jgi:hypothetical protein
VAGSLKARRRDSSRRMLRAAGSILASTRRTGSVTGNPSHCWITHCLRFTRVRAARRG